MGPMASSSEVFLVPVGDRCLVHAPLHGVRGVVNASAGRLLESALASGDATSLPDGVRALAERLLLPPAACPSPPAGAFAPHRLALLLTSDCNLRCHYCAPSAGEGASLTMAPEVASAALRAFAGIARREALPAYTLFFFGGEPFLRWDLLQSCIAEAGRLADDVGVPLQATATTNAVLSPARAAWVAKHFRFVIVSLDGPEAVHDRHRPTVGGEGSYAAAARSLAIFAEHGLAYGIRCTVERATAPRLPAIARFLCDEFQPAVINFEPVIPSGRCASSGLAAPDPEEFVRGVMEAAKIAGEHGVRLMLTTARTRRVARSNCGVAADQCVVTPDGFVSTCFAANHQGAPLADPFLVGRVDAGAGCFAINSRRLAAARALGVEQVPACRDCFCKWHCSGGCRVYHTPTAGGEPVEAMCQMTRRLTLWQLLQEMAVEENLDGSGVAA